MPTLSTSFTTFASAARSGSVASWQNPSNAQTSNDVRTSTTTVSASGYTSYLKATGLAASLPSDAIIEGIKVTVQRRDASGATTDSEVRLVVGGSIVGNNKADAGTAWPTADADASYGGSADLWGLTPTAAQLNGSDFGVVVSATVSDGGALPEGGP